jgi:hypothetical protein
MSFIPHHPKDASDFVNEPKQALRWNMLCGIGVRFNSIYDAMLGGLTDKRCSEDREVL